MNMARVKGQIIEVEAVRLQCHRCKVWYIYHGRSRERSVCPKCITTNMFDVVVKEKGENRKE